jgi:hypothetical protein
MEDGKVEVDVGRIVAVSVTVKRDCRRTGYEVEYDRETKVLERIRLFRSHSRDVVIPRETLMEIVAILERLGVRLC